MKKTLLEITQDILNDLDADEVNSIDDTIEAQQVAQIVQSCYYEMIANRNWPHTRQLVQLEASGSTSYPNFLLLPSNLKQMDLFRYNVGSLTEPDFKEIPYKEPFEFLDYIAARNNNASNLVIISDITSGTPLSIFNNVAPSYWTSFDDQYLVTDSYDSSVSTTLVKARTQAVAYIVPSWVRTDEAYPDLPIEAFPALIEEAKSTAFLAIKQMANQKAEQKAARQQRWLARKAWQAKGGISYPNYGRRGKN